MSSAHQLRTAARVLRDGGVIAHPTEGVYGLACDPFDAGAVERILRLKGRAFDAGFIVLAESVDTLQALCVPLPADRWAEITASWPGPLTWIVPAAPWVPPWITGGRDTLAARITAFAPAAALCRLAGGLLVSTSANPSGKPPARSALRTRVYFRSGLDGLLGGPTGGLARPTPIRDAVSGRWLRH
ncbi:MAG: Sua5/YciO/YrdC/YwlC family protein [Gammaproteobacteria bacterium]|nr:MAG: Sua5/YciO/YrdC/YwlC family protein [Gammaproteobacteria bacterium]